MSHWTCPKKIEKVKKEGLNTTPIFRYPSEEYV